MAIGNLFGSGGESNSLYGTSLTSGGSIPAASSFIYFEWFIFKVSASQPATPTGGSWDFLTNTGTAPTGWVSNYSGIPLDNMWFSIAFVDSRNPTGFTWSTPGLISATTSVYASAYADKFTGNGSTTAWTLSADPVTVQNLDVSVNGVTQTPTTDYTISGTTFTTTTASPLGSIILVKYRQALPNSYYGLASNVGFTPSGWIASTNVQTALAEVATDIAATDGVSGSNLIGYKPAGTGAVATTVQAKLRQTVSVKDFGASPSETGAANTIAFQTAFNAAIAANCALYVPAGEYNIATSITPTYVTDSADPMLRNHSILIYGDGYASTILKYAGTGYCFDYTVNIASAYTDYIHVEGIQIATTTGGGISMPASGGVVVNDFFMNGCASGKWGLSLDGSFGGGVGIYNIDIGNSRFWHPTTGYAGGAIFVNNFFNCHIHDSFTSQNQKNGAINLIQNGRELMIDNCMIEGTNASSTLQTGIALGPIASDGTVSATDSIFNTMIQNCHFEGNLDTAIRLGTTRQFNVYALNVDAAFLAGKSSPIIFDASTATNHFGVRVDGLQYYSADTNAGTGYIVNDPNALVSMQMSRNFNASAGAQLSRAWKQITDWQLDPNVRFGYTSTGIVRQSSASSIPSTTWHKWSGVASDFYASRVATDTLGNTTIGVAPTAAVIGSETITDVIGIDRAQKAFKFLNAANIATGAQTTTLGTASPAITATPYKWITVIAPDGSTCYMPIWK